MVTESFHKLLFFSFSHINWFGDVETDRSIQIGPTILDVTLVSIELPHTLVNIELPANDAMTMHV
jgi:hypothetical protein